MLSKYAIFIKLVVVKISNLKTELSNQLQTKSNDTEIGFCNMLPKMALNIGQSEISGLIWRIANDLVGINDQTCFLFGELYIYIYIYIYIYKFV